MNSFLEVSVVFALATILAFVMRKWRLPLLVGYLITGIVVGPLGLNLVHESEHLHLFAQLGISALLFIIGLTLSPHVLVEMGKTALITGIGQCVLTAVPAFFLARALGFESVASLYVAIALTLSSTIVVSKILSDKKALGTLHGKLAIGFLLVQDIVAAFALLAMTSLGRGEGGIGLLLSFGKTLLFFVVLYVLGMWILPRFTPFFAASQDVLFLFSLGWGIGIAGVFAVLGLSFELGALAAGLTLASSPYHHEMGMRMRIVRDFFMVVFFALLGAQLATPFADIPWKWVGLLSIFVLVGKPLIILVLLKGLGFHRKVSFLTGISVAQMSEFSFILISLGVSLGHVPASVFPLTTLVGIITIAVSSLWLTSTDKMYYWFERWSRFIPWSEAARRVRQESSYRPRVVLIGCHRIGSHLLSLVQRWKGPYLVVDFDPGIVKALTARGIPCVYGDASEHEFLEEIGLPQAEIVISTVTEPEVQRALLRAARKGRQAATVVLVASSAEEAMGLYQQGASYVVNLHDVTGRFLALMLQESGGEVTELRKKRKQHVRELQARLRGPEFVSTDIHHRWVHLH